MVFVNGRPTVERRARIVVETVYEDVSELREFTLPFTSGAWSSIDLCLYSTWSIFHVGPDGTVFGMGTTVGNQLYGSVLYIGVEGLPSGWYTLSTGEPGGSAGGGGGGGGGGGNPPA